MYKLANSLAQRIELGFDKQPKMEEIETALHHILLEIASEKELFDKVSRQDLLSPNDLQFNMLELSYARVLRLQQLLTEENRAEYIDILGKYVSEFVKYSKGVHKYRTKWNYDVGNANIDYFIGGLTAGTLLNLALILFNFSIFPFPLLTLAGGGSVVFIKRKGYEQNQKRFEIILNSLSALAQKVINEIDSSNKI